MTIIKTYQITCHIAVARSDAEDGYSSYTDKIVVNLAGPDEKQASKILKKKISKNDSLKWTGKCWTGCDKWLIKIQNMVLIDINLKEE